MSSISGGAGGGAWATPPEPPTPRERSVLPMILGALMIAFAIASVLLGLVNLARFARASGAGHFPPAFGPIQFIRLGLGFGLAALHLVAGIFLSLYRRIGWVLANVYGVCGVLWQLMGLLGLVAVFHRLRETLSPMALLPALVYTTFFLLWAVLILVLVNQPSARAACTR